MLTLSRFKLSHLPFTTSLGNKYHSYHLFIGEGNKGTEKHDSSLGLTQLVNSRTEILTELVWF